MASRNTHPFGKPAGLSPADIQRNAKPAAYLASAELRQRPNSSRGGAEVQPAANRATRRPGGASVVRPSPTQERRHRHAAPPGQAHSEDRPSEAVVGP